MSTLADAPKDYAADFFTLEVFGTNDADAVRCVMCQTIWCQHVGNLILMGKDTAPHLWRTSTERDGPMCVLVPLLPHKYGLFVEIWLQNFDTETGKVYPGGICKVLVHVGGQLWKENDTLGFWCPGEGRRSLRSAIIRWLRSEPLLDPIRCPSGAHDYRAAQRLEQATVDYELASRWMIATKSVCVACSEYTNFNADAPEL